MRATAALLVASTLFLNACYMPQVTVKHAPAPSEHLRVAVLPFKDAPGAPGSGEAAAETLTAALLRIPSYEVIDRGALDQVIQEQKLGTTGAISQETAAQLGKLLGADALVVGAVTEYRPRNFLIFPPARATVSARMVATNTSEIEWAGIATSGWQPIKWVTCVFWPLGAFWTVTSPSEQNRLERASKIIARKVASQIASSSPDALARR